MADTARQELAKLISGVSAPPYSAFQVADRIIARWFIKSVASEYGVFLDDKGSMDMFPDAAAAAVARTSYTEPVLERGVGAWTPLV